MIECYLYVTSFFLDTYVDQSCIDIYDKIGCYITFPLGFEQLGYMFEGGISY